MYRGGRTVRWCRRARVAVESDGHVPDLVCIDIDAGPIFLRTLLRYFDILGDVDVFTGDANCLVELDDAGGVEVLLEDDLYTARQLKELLENQVEKAFKPGSVPDEVLELIAEKLLRTAETADKLLKHC